ncbi:MAG: Asp-tRNA(Asn)/Glu-tRNA(Gln) amidotransferase subunit GatA [Lautropia sp.]|nr:MAG: Asp-tRNA(Asn)/Glu-tRNA(Gln) amidotransferase subunit GatA [Pseudomonadota bacterium]MBC6959912.1 Asp-tRNA(Asn)/Glu-tRNA(Gln) amidotransferase subunit GatA [Lautropia sp.]MCL4700763.1 Asp-tRNA(Asn)/Glu-tRNA(Gln) amidotransferase subunit GatA [Burkholderiaceae bacterium]MCZ2415345.1 Asp-tRNA(Asn)/Glu-tRNA(Gln) amidotransferase subunit GatA [Burkholderiales bacterium]MDL1908439.1 Asp-tRNA(Asn)/Glu-tRNA(Gln) amidotransferase subunit GatA [Betaproteobacteria bacterium PRO1]
MSSAADSLRALAALLERGEASALELADERLARIAASDLNAFIDVQPELTREQARQADARRARGERGALLGVPLAHKDVFVTRGWRSTAGSKMLEHYVSPFDAAVVERLAAAGAVCLGKTNCDEFAMGGSSEHSYFGPVRNPWDRAAIPGGSSGGSAAAVAAGLAPVATGTDTGGSIRQPAAMCGVTGIRPTYGRVSRHGMIAFASSLDQAGVIARSADDCATVLGAIAGFDPRDSTSAERADEDFGRELGRPIEGLRIGVPREFFGAGLAADVRAPVEAAIEEFRRLGAVLVDVSLPQTELSIPAYYVIALAEASSNLSRFDGVRYGHRAAQHSDLLDMYCRTRAEGFGAEVKRRVLVGTWVLSHGYYDAYYLQAQKLRRLVADDFRRVFETVDLVAGPVAPTAAWDIGAIVDDPVANYLADVYTLPASLAGLPGMSLPAGFGQRGRPVGLQLIGRRFDEARLLGAAHGFQQATDWHLRRPA